MAFSQIEKTLYICRIYVPFKKEFPHKFRNISKKIAAFLPHYLKKSPHYYRIILKNHRMSTACIPHIFLPERHAAPHYFGKYRI